MNNKVALSKHENFDVVISTLKVMGDYVNSIHDSIQGHRIMKYWNEQVRFPADQNEYIDWDFIRHDCTGLTIDRKYG